MNHCAHAHIVGVFLEGFDLGLVSLIKELCIQMKLIVGKSICNFSVSD
jgi:hypothetical protein